MIIEHKNLTISRMTSGTIPELPFQEIKKHILGNNYDLSIVFPDQSLSIMLHKKFKSKNDPVNILSFPLDENSGEIFITLNTARVECKKWKLSYHQYLVYLLIHGCTHLRGLDHGDEMDRLEKKYCSTFNIPYPYNDE